MGFFDALRRALQGDVGGPAGTDLAAAWGLTEDGADAGPTRPGELNQDASAYDRGQWLKKMKRILAELPASQGQWPELMTEARALNLDPEWVNRAQVEEFLLLVRRAVADRRFTEDEHRTLDLARDLIGLPDADAEAALRSVVAEAESFFGKSVEGG